jgi:hypothetical protein
VKPADISKKETKVNIDKNKLIGEIFENCPFKEVSPEIHYLESEGDGRNTYIEINSDNPDFYKTKKIEIFNPEKQIHESILPKGTKVRNLGLHNIGNKTIQYLRQEEGEKSEFYPAKKGTIYKVEHDLKTGETDIEYSGTHYNGLDIGRINVGDSTETIGNIHVDQFYRSTGSPIKNNMNYLEGIRATLNKLNKDKFNGPNVSYKDRANRLAFHLYGFSEEARINGDIDTEKIAYGLANTVYPADKYNEVKRQRIRKDGGFRMLPQDIGIKQ